MGSDFFRRELEGHEKALGPKHPDTLKREMDNLASALARLSMFGSPGARQGKRDEALALYHRDQAGGARAEAREHARRDEWPGELYSREFCPLE